MWTFLRHALSVALIVTGLALMARSGPSTLRQFWAGLVVVSFGAFVEVVFQLPEGKARRPGQGEDVP